MQPATAHKLQIILLKSENTGMGHNYLSGQDLAKEIHILENDAGAYCKD